MAVGEKRSHVDVQRVLEHDQAPRDARHLSDRLSRVGEVVRRDAAHDDVEGAVRERELLGRTHDVGLHPGGGVARDHRAAELTKSAPNVTAAGASV